MASYLSEPFFRPQICTHGSSRTAVNQMKRTESGSFTVRSWRSTTTAMVQEVYNRSRTYTYFNRESRSQHESIWDLLTLDCIARANPDAHDFNTSFFIPRPDQ